MHYVVVEAVQVLQLVAHYWHFKGSAVNMLYPSGHELTQLPSRAMTKAEFMHVLQPNYVLLKQVLQFVEH